MTETAELSELVEIARQAAEAGAKVACKLFYSGPALAWNKSDRSRVTEADLASEAEVLSVLQRLDSECAVLSEEAGGDQNLRERWIVDPIDGTENFSRRHPIWATLVAREANAVVQVAVAVAPVIDHSWWAARGQGAFLECRHGLRRLAVSTCEERSLATFDYGGLHDCPTARHREAVVRAASKFRCAWGCGNFWGHVQVADGAAEAALSYGAEIWDVAVPSLLVSEAGGRWTDTEGRTSLYAGSLITSNGRFHNQIVDDLREIPRRSAGDLSRLQLESPQMEDEVDIASNSAAEDHP